MYKLDTNPIDLLTLGIKFRPGLKSYLRESKRDLKQFERKFRLIEKFSNKKTDDSPVKNSSKFFRAQAKKTELNAPKRIFT